MRAKYVFISNSTKPSRSERASRSDIGLTNFSRPCLEAAQELGYEVYLGVNRESPQELRGELGISYYDASTYRSVLDVRSNIVALINLLRLLRRGGVEVIHCNTPIGGLVGRIGGKIGGARTVIYTAHGFHFFRGGNPFKNYVFKRAETILARFTDAIITVNSEDFEAASEFRLRGPGRIYSVPGVGIDLEKFSGAAADRDAFRKSLGIPRSSYVYTCAGDLVARKDYATAIKALGLLGRHDAHLVICGTGPERDRLERLASEQGLQRKVHFLGRREDMPRILKASDVFLFTSRQEGLPRAVMEAMASGLPCVVSRVRGNVDLVINEQGGYVCDVGDSRDFAHKMSLLQDNPATAERMGAVNLSRSAEYGLDRVRSRILSIYSELLGPVRA